MRMGMSFSFTLVFESGDRVDFEDVWKRFERCGVFEYFMPTYIVPPVWRDTARAIDPETGRPKPFDEDVLRGEEAIPHAWLTRSKHPLLDWRLVQRHFDEACMRFPKMESWQARVGGNWRLWYELGGKMDTALAMSATIPPFVLGPNGETDPLEMDPPGVPHSATDPRWLSEPDLESCAFYDINGYANVWAMRSTKPLTVELSLS